MIEVGIEALKALGAIFYIESPNAVLSLILFWLLIARLLEGRIRLLFSIRTQPTRYM
jgi:hypothetical protein